jgi:hypothetical protein
MLTRAASRTEAVRGALLAGVLLGAVLVLSTPASAGIGSTLDVHVTTTADTVDGGDGVVSLREAFDQSNASTGNEDRIHLQEGATYVLDRCVGGTDEDANVGGDLDHTRALAPGVEIRGNGATILQTCEDERVIHFTTFTRLTLDDVTITGGDSNDVGGGLLVGANGLRLRQARIVGNAAAGPGGGAFVGGGGSIPEVVDSVISDNTAGDAGGGLFSNNQVGLIRSAVTGNSAAGDGGGIWANNTFVSLTDSTVTDNLAAETGGAISAPSIDLTRSTVVDNRSLAGGSLQASVEVVSTQSVIVPSTVPFSGTACDTPAGGSFGYTYAADGTCGVGGSTGDVVSAVPPNLAPLAMNGGPTPTRLPNAGSPLIGAVPAGFEDCEATDQRGVGRPQGGACEIGAVEVPLPFTDVSTGHPFFSEIMWMDANGISNGFDDGTYQPSASVSRQAMSAFMYRLASEPVFTPGNPTFTDVSETHPFFEEIEWMADEGISEGYLPGPTYRPSSPVTRQAMSAFMYRLAGEPPFDPGSPTFTDVSDAHPFFKEIEWMAALDITTGFQPGPTYRPATNVSRQAMSAFMQRLAAHLT